MSRFCNFGDPGADSTCSLKLHFPLLTLNLQNLSHRSAHLIFLFYSPSSLWCRLTSVLWFTLPFLGFAHYLASLPKGESEQAQKKRREEGQNRKYSGISNFYFYWTHLLSFKSTSPFSHYTQYGTCHISEHLCTF